MRSRNSRTRTAVQVPLSVERQRIRFMVTANSRSGHWPCKVRKIVLGRAAEVAVVKRAKTGLAEVKRSA